MGLDVNSKFADHPAAMIVSLQILSFCTLISIRSSLGYGSRGGEPRHVVHYCCIAVISHCNYFGSASIFAMICCIAVIKFLASLDETRRVWVLAAVGLKLSVAMQVCLHCSLSAALQLVVHCIVRLDIFMCSYKFQSKAHAPGSNPSSKLQVPIRVQAPVPSSNNPSKSKLHVLTPNPRSKLQFQVPIHAPGPKLQVPSSEFQSDFQVPIQAPVQVPRSNPSSNPTLNFQAATLVFMALSKARRGVIRSGASCGSVRKHAWHGKNA